MSGAAEKTEIFAGVNCVTFGVCEKFCPSQIVKQQSLLSITDGFAGSALKEAEVSFYLSGTSTFLELPLKENEDIYGLGLMFKSFKHTRSQKRLKVNSDPLANTGDSHAPVPFYLSSNGYGVLVDSARIITISIGNARKKENRSSIDAAQQNSHQTSKTATSIEELYARKEKSAAKIIIQIPNAEGARLFLFNGKNMLDAVCKYNLFCGGGCMPPMWSLNTIYRCYGESTEQDVISLAEVLKQDKMACNVIGLEPGWQTHSYSCSLKVNESKFPNFENTVKSLNQSGFHVNLWEHIFLHKTSTLYQTLYGYSGDYEVWEGIVPDFTVENCEKIFMEYTEKTLMEKGIDGFKLDECDDSDFSTNWSFPSYSKFPGGMDGEQMHTVLGALLQKMFDKSFKKANKRYFSQARSSGAGASGYSFALYTDLYDQADYLRGVVNCGFSGLLFSPEVRQCDSENELLRRLELAAFSPQCCVNGWMIPSPPWKQYDITKNLKGEKCKNYKQLTLKAKEILDMRQAFVPVLYSLYYRYNLMGEPPIRAMVLNYPNDLTARDCDNQFMLGDFCIVAPHSTVIGQRQVYLPHGDWYNFHTHQKSQGNSFVTLEANSKIGIFIKAGTVLPLQSLKNDGCGGDNANSITAKFNGATKSSCNCDDSTCYIPIDLICFGGKGECSLLEDDGQTYNYLKGDCNIVSVKVQKGGYSVNREGNYNKHIYKINSLTIVE